MGLSKGGGYEKLPTVSRQQNAYINQLLGQSLPNMQQAAAGYQQFLPQGPEGQVGGVGGEAFKNQAMQQFQQETVPSILNQYGAGSKGSSALNQALAAGGANLNTNLASILAGTQLQAAQGLGGLGAQQGGLGTQQTFGYQQQQQPFWQQALLAGIGGGSNIFGSYLGRK